MSIESLPSGWYSQNQQEYQPGKMEHNRTMKTMESSMPTEVHETPVSPAQWQQADNRRDDTPTRTCKNTISETGQGTVNQMLFMHA